MKVNYHFPIEVKQNNAADCFYGTSRNREKDLTIQYPLTDHYSNVTSTKKEFLVDNS